MLFTNCNWSPDPSHACFAAIRKKHCFPRVHFFSEKMRNSVIVLNFVEIWLDHDNFSPKIFRACYIRFSEMFCNNNKNTCLPRLHFSIERILSCTRLGYVNTKLLVRFFGYHIRFYKTKCKNRNIKSCKATKKHI